MNLRRLGSKMDAASACGALDNCPLVAEDMDSGDFLVVGEDMTEALKEKLPSDIGVAPHERIVRIPRSILIAARRDIPKE